MWFGSGVNFTPARNVYPNAPGATSGQIGGIAAVGSNTSPVTTAAPSMPVAAVSTSGGSSAIFWVALVALFFALRFAANKWGSEGSFSNIKSSVYNVFFVTVAAVIGLSSLKAAMRWKPIPGLAEVINAA